jgi:cephalosporin hydroxylase
VLGWDQARRIALSSKAIPNEVIGTMTRRTRLAVYVAGAVICLMVALYRHLQPVVDNFAIRRVQQLVQTREEFKHRWMGVGVIQYPSDLITYAELVYQIRPEVIIETGTNYGGLAAFFATVVEGINPHVKIITVDIDSQKWDREVNEGRITPKFRERIVFIKGDSVSSQVLAEVRKYASGKRGFVILDSLHSKQHVLRELNLYSQFVGEGSYLIVNDTHLEILGLMESEPGPFSAVRDFIRSTDDFLIDPNLPGTVLSCAPSGFLKRVKTSPTRIELN